MPSNKVITTLLSVIMALIPIIGALIVYIFVGVKNDVDDLKKSSTETVKQLSDTRFELVKAINAVEVQATATNAKLDQLIADGRRPH